ncbi:MAG TPA: hypothetical protein VIX37_06405 [Candidatus Sulfotelmatobacter sp.]
MAYADYVAELVGTVPRMSALHAQQVLQRAWRRVRDGRRWSFQFVTDAQLFCPDAIVGGSVSATFGSNQVTADAAAAAAFNTVAAANPPLASTVLGVGRQLRVGSLNNISTPTGPNYNIVAWDGVSTLTIDKPYGEHTVAQSTYQVLKCYYAPPASPPFAALQSDLRFVRYEVITNKFSGYAIFGPNLYWSQTQLDAIDPQRGGQGDAYIVANYMTNQLGQPVVELYPNPVRFTTYSATYYSQWPGLSPTQDLPQVSYELPDLMMFQAKCLASDWALANVNTFPELQQTNWVAYRQAQMAEYAQSRIECYKQDDEQFPLIPFRQGQGFMFPLGGQFLQSHDVTSILPRGY